MQRLIHYSRRFLVSKVVAMKQILFHSLFKIRHNNYARLDRIQTFIYSAQISSKINRSGFKRALLLLTSLPLFFYAECSFADNLKQAVEIASHGSKFQAERLKIAAENMANEDSTGSTPGADAYRRKAIFAKNKYDKKIGANVVVTKKVDVDNSEFIMKYDPYHPAANDEGLVKYPNVTREIERADASEAQRSYEANLSVIEVSNSLMQKTVEAMGR